MHPVDRPLPGIGRRNTGRAAVASLLMHATPNASILSPPPRLNLLVSLSELSDQLENQWLQVAAASMAPPLKQTYGGPVPFGMGCRGLLAPLESAWSDFLDMEDGWEDPTEVMRKRAKARRRAVSQVARNFRAPIHHLDEESQREIHKLRLKVHSIDHGTGGIETSMGGCGACL